MLRLIVKKKRSLQVRWLIMRENNGRRSWDNLLFIKKNNSAGKTIMNEKFRKANSEVGPKFKLRKPHGRPKFFFKSAHWNIQYLISLLACL